MRKEIKVEKPRREKAKTIEKIRNRSKNESEEDAPRWRNIAYTARNGDLEVERSGQCVW